MCLSTENPGKCFCATKMNTSEVEDAETSISDCRTSDENRCDSTALLKRELKLTAEKCSIMAAKLTKSGSIQKHRKQQYGSCEQQTEIEEFQHLVATLKLKVAALQKENMMLQKLKKNQQHGSLCEQQTGVEMEELQPLVTNLEYKVLALLSENIKLQKLKKCEQHNGVLCEQLNEIPEIRSSTELQHKVSALRAENLKLRQLLKDVTEVNKRWQKYNRETQAYIQRLEESIRNQNHKELDSPLFSLHDEASLTDRRNARLSPGSRHSDSQLEQASGQATLRLRYENAVKEVCKLQKQMEDSQQIQEALMQQMELLRNDKTDQLMLLELQTKAYKEDWDAEKKEKIIAQEKVSQLIEEIRELQIELKDCKKRLKHIQATSSGSNPSEGVWNKVKPTLPFHSRLSGIKSWASALTERGPYYANNIGIVVADAADETQKSQSAPTSWENVKVDDLEDSSLTDDDKNALECPGCKKSFPRSLHLQFLDHFEECQAPHVES